MKLQGVQYGDILLVTHEGGSAQIVERYRVTEFTPAGKAVRARRISIESEHRELSFNVSTGNAVGYCGISARRESV